MKLLKVWFVLVAAVIGVSRAAAAQTQPLGVTVTVKGDEAKIAGSDTDHFVTFEVPVEIPGVGLAPGRYVFRFIAPTVVQVLSGDRSQVYAMFLTSPTSRITLSDGHDMTFERTRDDAPIRLVAWFLPYQSIGYQPVYPTETENR